MSKAATKLLLELTPALAERLQRVCEAQGATKMGIVRRALEIYLRQLDVTESQQFLVDLPPDTAETLAAYREVRNYPAREKLVETALLAHIEREVADDKSLFSKLEQAKAAQARKRIHPINKEVTGVR